MQKNLTRYLILSFITFFKIIAFSQPVVHVTEANFSTLGWYKGQINKDDPNAPADREKRKLATDLVYIDCDEESSIETLRPGSIYISYPKNTADPHIPKSKRARSKNDPTLFRCLLFNYNYDGIELQDITELKYSTYTVRTPLNTTPSKGVSIHPVVAPILILQIDMEGDGKYINNVSFIPHLQRTFTGSGYVSSMELSTWQEWDALNGTWLFFLRPGGGPYQEEKGMLYDSLKKFWMKHPKAKIINNDFNTLNGGGGVRFMVGPFRDNVFDDFRGYVDAFRIKTKATFNDPGRDILYDFDGECRRIIVLPHWLPNWFFNPLIVLSIIGIVVIGYLMMKRKKLNLPKAS